MSLKEMKWPHHKDFMGKPHWNTELFKFMEILNSVKDERWWICGPELKYITIRIDTRDDAFLLFIDKEGTDDPKTRIDPQRVVDAIEKYKEKYTCQK